MLKIEIPGSGELRLEHLVLDYNGTIAIDGILIVGVKTRLTRLSEHLRIHVVTADTFGSTRSGLAGIRCELSILDVDRQAARKLEYVKRLGRGATVAVGNGRNDRLMLSGAALGIAVIQKEGASSVALRSADVVTHDILDALDLLAKPKRLTATLRT